MKSLVSVIIPVYKNAHFLKDSINSVVNQDYKKLEIIVVNDGSPETCKIIRIIKNIHSNKKIRLINLKSNKGVSFALNVGLKKSNGNYFCWLSHDDFIHPQKIRLQYEALITSKKKICFSNFYQVNEQKKIIKKINITNNLFAPRVSILFRDNFNFCSALFKKSVFKNVGNFNIKKKHTQDYDMLFKLFKKYDPIILNNYLLYSRKHNKQNSRIYDYEAAIEKNDLYLSKFSYIKKIFKDSHFIKKIYIIIFLKVKNLKDINFEITMLINKQKILSKLILKLILTLCEIFKSNK